MVIIFVHSHYSSQLLRREYRWFENQIISIVKVKVALLSIRHLELHEALTLSYNVSLCELELEITASLLLLASWKRGRAKADEENAGMPISEQNRINWSVIHMHPTANIAFK